MAGAAAVTTDNPGGAQEQGKGSAPQSSWKLLADLSPVISPDRPPCPHLSAGCGRSITKIGLSSSEFALELSRVAFLEELILEQKGGSGHGCWVGNVESAGGTRG